MALVMATAKKMVAKVSSHALVLSNNNHWQPNRHLALKAMVLVMATTKMMVAKVNSHTLVLSNDNQ